MALETEHDQMDFPQYPPLSLNSRSNSFLKLNIRCDVPHIVSYSHPAAAQFAI